MEDNAIKAPKLRVIENADLTGENAPRKSKRLPAGMSPCQLLDGSGQTSTSSTQSLFVPRRWNWGFCVPWGRRL